MDKYRVYDKAAVHGITYNLLSVRYEVLMPHRPPVRDLIIIIIIIIIIQ